MTTTTPARVRLVTRTASGPVPALLANDVNEALTAVRAWPDTPRPGEGATAELWETLATVAATDLAVARAVEPHLDALAILHQAGVTEFARVPPAQLTWGVFAAEGPAGRVLATPGNHSDETWRLTGAKPWCSLADRLDAALITAFVPSGERRLFAIDLRAGGITLSTDRWVSRGLSEIPSVGIALANVAGRPVGDTGWYLTRPGFEWGGMGVAACWYGGAVGLARTVFAAVSERDDQDLLMAGLGRIDEQLTAARTALAHAAGLVDGEQGRRREVMRVAAKRVRAVVARACEDVLATSAHVLGPAPLTMDEDHAKRVADLQVYVRQHHGERDLAALGRALVTDGPAPW